MSTKYGWPLNRYPEPLQDEITEAAADGARRAYTSNARREIAPIIASLPLPLRLAYRIAQLLRR